MTSNTHFEWAEHEFAWATPQSTVEFAWNSFMEVPHTLRRTIVSVEVRMIATSENPVFPDPQPRPILFSIYQNTEVAGQTAQPVFDAFQADWLWRQGIPFTPGFGIVSPVALDAVYMGSLYIDSAAQRKIDVDFPWGKIFIAPPLSTNENTQSARLPEHTGTVWIRQLWWTPQEHPPIPYPLQRPREGMVRMTNAAGDVTEDQWYRASGDGMWEPPQPDTESLLRMKAFTADAWQRGGNVR